MYSLQAGARTRPFVAHYTRLLFGSLLVILLSGTILSATAQAPASAVVSPAGRLSAFVTSTRPSPTQAARPDRGGGSLGQASSRIQSTAPTVQQASTASTADSSRSSEIAGQTGSPLDSSDSSSAMAPVWMEATTGSASLDTKLDAAFGILGAALVLSGLVLATAGAAYRRLTCFLVTTYAMATVTMALILHFGVEKQINPPRSAIRVAFVVASLAAGAICGLGAAIFHRGAKIVIAPVAGFLFGLVLQSVRNDGLVRPIGPRYLLFLGLAGVAFILGLIPRYFDAVLLVSTAFLGALSFALGTDCFTTAGLKEFFVMNLGFTGLLPRLEGHFSISSIMQIELGLIALIFCISIAVQIRFFNLFEKRLARFFAKTEETEKRQREEEEAAARIKNVMNGDVEKFEHRYSRRFPFAIPGSLPTLPGQAHIDSTSSSPSLPSHTGTFNTPKSESTPFLPELTYVTTGSKKGSSARKDDDIIAIKTSESNKSFFSQMKSFMHTSGDKDNDVPPVPSLPSAVEQEKSEEVLTKEIADREQALEKIKTIRQSIDDMRSHLRTQSQDGSSSSSNPASTSGASRPTSPAQPVKAVKPPAHRHSVSFTGVPEAVHRRSTSASFAAPRPLSQHSIITTQQHARPPLQAYTRSASQQTVNNSVRPVSTYSNWASGQGESGTRAGMQSRRHSTMTVDTGRTSLTSGEIQQSQRVIFADPTRYSTGPPQRIERIVTGVMPARPPVEQQAAAPQRRSMVRTKTMDILDLHKAHQKEISKLQGAVVGGGTGEPRSSPMTTSASQPVLKAVEPIRKRSSTVTGLSSMQSASLPSDIKRQKRHSDLTGIDEFGKRPSPTLRTGISPSATMPISASKTQNLPKSVPEPVKAATSLDAAKDSEAAWLSY